MASGSVSRSISAAFDNVRPGCYMLHCMFDAKLGIPQKEIAIEVHQLSKSSDKAVTLWVESPSFSNIASKVYQSGQFYVLEPDLLKIQVRVKIASNVQCISVELLRLFNVKSTEVCFAAKENSYVIWINDERYYSITELYSKPIVYLKEVCWLDLGANFSNVTGGDYLIYWKIKLNDRTNSNINRAIDLCDSSVWTKNINDDTDISLVYPQRISHNRECRNLQLIYGGEFNYDATVGNGDVYVRLHSADHYGWKCGVYFDSVILLEKPKGKAGMKLSDFAMKTFLESSFTAEDYYIAMRTMYPDRTIGIMEHINEHLTEDEDRAESSGGFFNGIGKKIKRFWSRKK